MKLIFINYSNCIHHKFISHNNDPRIAILLKMLYNYSTGLGETSIMNPEKVITQWFRKL